MYSCVYYAQDFNILPSTFFLTGLKLINALQETNFLDKKKLLP